RHAGDQRRQRAGGGSEVHAHPQQQGCDLRPGRRLGRGRSRGLHQAVRHELDLVGRGQPVMDALLDATLAHLRVLVGFDTRNPPRAIGTDGIFDYLRAQLPGFDVEVTDHGAGAVSLFAIRGKPKLLFNVHLDTVPDSPQWSASPFELRVTDGRAIGLGACDIKGAAAAMLAAANASNGGMAMLFTTDEEGAAPRCIRAFLENRPVFANVIVAEPTRCKAVLAHRGIQSVRARFEGRAGHASGEQQPSDSALHQAVRWSAAALNFAEARLAESFGELHGMRFN